MTWLRTLRAVWLHNAALAVTQPRALVQHVHYWDYCRTYGQYRYRICLNECGQRRSC